MSSWTASVIDLRPSSNGVEAVVIVTDGVAQKFQQCYQTDGTLASLAPQVRATTTAKDAAAVKHDLVLGILDLTPPAVVTPPPPDPTVVQFQSDLSALQREVRALALGLTTGNDVNALRTPVQSALSKTPTLGALI